MASVRQIVDELRRRGVTVHEWPGWDGRGNEGVKYIDAKGGIVHHTGSGYGSAYPGLVVSTRPDLLGGMLCNFAGNEDGSLTVIGTGLAWHAAPATGPSLGALAPYGRSLNRYTVGLEIVYPGTSPMRPAQYQTAVAFARVVADLCAGGNVEVIRAHAEGSPSGKWDPGYAPGLTIDMAAFRRDAANFQGDDMSALAEQQIADIHRMLGAGNAAAAIKVTETEKTLGYKVSDIQAALTKALPVLLANAQEADNADPAAIAAAVVAAIPAGIAQDVIDGLGQRLAASPA